MNFFALNETRKLTTQTYEISRNKCLQFKIYFKKNFQRQLFLIDYVQDSIFARLKWRCISSTCEKITTLIHTKSKWRGLIEKDHGHFRTCHQSWKLPITVSLNWFTWAPITKNHDSIHAAFMKDDAKFYFFTSSVVSLRRSSSFFWLWHLSSNDSCISFISISCSSTWWRSNPMWSWRSFSWKNMSNFKFPTLTAHIYSELMAPRSSQRAKNHGNLAIACLKPQRIQQISWHTRTWRKLYWIWKFHMLKIKKIWIKVF